jgi:plasmid stability protein
MMKQSTIADIEDLLSAMRVRQANISEELGSLDDVEAVLEQAVGLRELVDMIEDTAVQSGRQLGLSWSQIGSALGISKQAAQQRYAPARLS